MAVERNVKGKEPMFPVDETITTGQETYSYTDDFGNTKTGTHTLYGTAHHLGMSKRLFIATMAMQGILAGNTLESLVEYAVNMGVKTETAIITQSLAFADVLLEREDK